MSTSAASPTAVAPEGNRRASRPGLTLAIIVTCQLMVLLDATVVTIALPHIQRALGFSATGLSWVQNAYLLPFGGLLLLGGRAGDIFGRRRVFVIGITIFTAASLAGGLATTAAWLIAARAVQGAGAALAAPGTLSLIATNFEEGPRRNHALSIFSAVAGSGMAIGLILGGLLTTASWRWVFFINVPIGVAVAVAAPLFVREPPRHPGRLDLAGALTSGLGLTALVYGLVRATTGGWGAPVTIAVLAAALVLIAAFVLVETRNAQPILPLRLLAQRSRASAYLDMLVIPALMFGVFFFLTQFFQDVLGYGPLAAGCAFLPLAVTQLGAARMSPKVLARFGARRTASAGAALILGGIIWLTQISAATGYAAGLLGPLLLFGVGVGLSFMPLNMTILAGVPMQDAGAASGLLQALQQIGGSLGLAIGVTVFGAASQRARHAPPPGLSGAALAHEVFAHGIAAAYTAGAVFAALALVIVVVGISGPKRPPAAAPTAPQKGA